MPLQGTKQIGRHMRRMLETESSPSVSRGTSRASQRSTSRWSWRERFATLCISKPTANADFAGGRADRKSQTGGFLLLYGMAVSWTANQQGSVSLSTMEAEFVAASKFARELIGLR